MKGKLAGLRVLVVEDEMLVCMDIEDMLEEVGCKVVGPAARVSDALAILDTEPVDIALLDVNLGREKSYPIADRLARSGTPFLLSTGYAEVDPPYNDHLRLQKPFSRKHLTEVLEELRREVQTPSG